MFAWFVALTEAAVLASDAVIETRKQIHSTAVVSAEWDSTVVPKVLGLIEKTMPALSSGFGTSVLGMVLTFWTIALAAIVPFLDGINPWPLLVVSVMISFSALPVKDVDSASSDCDAIHDSLNAKRYEDQSAEAYNKLQILEELLDRLNKKQGLGFVAGGKVFDRTTIKTAFIAIGGFLGFIVPLLLAFRPEATVAGTDVCSLNAGQVLVINGAISSAGANSSTCSYDNTTIGSVLRVKTDDVSLPMLPLLPSSAAAAPRRGWRTYVKLISPKNGSHYAYRDGYLAKTEPDALPRRNATLSQARSACDASADCIAFCFEASEAEPQKAKELLVLFKKPPLKFYPNPPPAPPGGLPARWLTQPLNHFNGADTRTWEQRYWTSAAYVNKSRVPAGGVVPLFLMLGAEGEQSPYWLQGAIACLLLKIARLLLKTTCLLTGSHLTGSQDPCWRRHTRGATVHCSLRSSTDSTARASRFRTGPLSRWRLRARSKRSKTSRTFASFSSRTCRCRQARLLSSSAAVMAAASRRGAGCATRICSTPPSQAVLRCRKRSASTRTWRWSAPVSQRAAGCGASRRCVRGWPPCR